jgi:hypothetical protein
MQGIRDNFNNMLLFITDRKNQEQTYFWRFNENEFRNIQKYAI